MMAETLFKPGARVAVWSGGWDRTPPQEAFVEKVYKNGNFVLKGSAQQWRSWGDRSAHPTGGGRHRPTAEIWDDETEKEVQKIRAICRRRESLHKIEDAIKEMRPETASDDVIAAIEAALANPTTKERDNG